MKILFLLRCLSIGGAERQAVTLAKQLTSMGHQTKIVVLYSGGELEGETLEAGIPLIYLNKKHRWEWLGVFHRWINLLHKEVPDVIHGYLPPQNVFCLLAKPFPPRNKKIIVGIRSAFMDVKQYDLLSRFFFFLERRLLHFADLAICNSQAGYKYIKSATKSSKSVSVIPNGIDCKRFSPQPQLKSTLRKEWKITSDAFIIGLVARLDPMKDHPTFFKAISLIAASIPKLHIVCIGAGPTAYRTKLTTYTQSLGIDERVTWLEASTDIEKIYHGFDIVALPSAFGEGFPNVLAEAMACSIPCITTDVGDAAMVVDNVGVVVPTRNPEAFASGIEMLYNRLQSERESLKKATRLRILENFDLSLLGQRTINAIASLNKHD